MLDIEKELRRLPKVNPSSQFCENAKARLMSRISAEPNGQWFARLLKRLTLAEPSAQFVQSARMRLLSRIGAVRRPMFGWLVWTQRVMASTLVLVLSVTTTLFFVEGRQPVSASENSTIEVISGEVSLKHADRLIWDTINEPTELSAGDMIRVGDTASATIHFFDDSELRLGDNSILLVSRLGVSPAYAGQGIIEVSLHQGSAWVQTLNVDDGYADFNLSTSNVSVSARNATFDVQTKLFEPTQVRILKHSALVRALQPETRLVLASGKLSAHEQVTLDPSTYNRNTSSLALFTPIHSISDEELNSDWVQRNLMADQAHLETLRERELLALKANAGTLPGDVLYPIKRAKERLELAFSFDAKAQTNFLAYMANQRLSEAIVLLEDDNQEAAEVALGEYKDLVTQITKDSNNDVSETKLASLVAAHRKTLVAALPGDIQVGIVNQALNRTQELLATDPIGFVKVRLQNSIDELIHAHDFLVAGDVASAQTALGAHTPIASDLLAQADSLTDEEKRVLYESILEAQYEEKRLFAEISRTLALGSNDDLIALAKSKQGDLEGDIRQTVAAIRPAMPEVVLSQAAAFSKAQKAKEFAEKVTIYKTWQGQKNQVKRLIAKYPQFTYDQEFWAKVRDNLDGTAKVVIESRIADLKYQEQQLKSKQLEQKITRAVRLREKRAEIKKEQSDVVPTTN